jgi:1-acyl-sn-glycerol-3-phosphate acyltransferase
MPEVAAIGPRRPAASPGTLRFLPRGFALILLLAYGLLLALLVRASPFGWLRPEPLGRHWSCVLLALLRIRVVASGPPPAAGGLVVANHISWLDIPVLYAQAGTRFVSKSEVQSWPIAGWLADAAGTFYLRRGAHASRPLLARMVPFLRSGGSVVIFPEGTTTTGEEVRPFHPRLFAAAIESGRAVQPVALRYGPGADGACLAPFVGDDDLVGHILRLLRNTGTLEARVVFGAPLDPAGRTREQLAEVAREAIRAA